ncbi:MAG: histidine kinase N-terminal 7TM domain-containing protein [Deferribacterales bacterium]
MPQLQFPPFAIIILCSALLTLLLSFYTFISAKDRTFFYFGFAFLIEGLWPLVYFIELISADPQISHALGKFRPVPIQMLPFLLTCATYLQVKRKMPPKWMYMTLAVSGILHIIIFIVFGDSRYIWEIYETLKTEDGYVLTYMKPGIFTKLSHLFFHDLTYLYGVFMLVNAIRKNRKPYRLQFIILSISIIFAIIFVALYGFNVIDFGYYNPSSTVFVFLSVAYLFSISKYNMLDTIPYAKESVFDIIQVAVMILDENEKLVDFNLQAKTTFHIDDKQIRNDIRDVLKNMNVKWEDITTDNPLTVPVNLSDTDKRFFSILKKEVKQSNIPGYIIVFADITHQYNAMKDAHAQEIVTYKESLLGDMHDGIGGVVASAALLSQSARDDSDVGEKDNKLDRIVRLLENGSYELRSMLNLLDKKNISWDTLVSDMREFSSTVLEAKGIKKKFNIVGEPFKNAVNFERYISIFRLFKETVTNIVKHSEATKVDISIYFSADSLRITVSDNGIGIDSSKSRGYGIKNMQNRVIKLGGTCDISSENGTTVDIKIKIS